MHTYTRIRDTRKKRRSTCTHSGCEKIVCSIYVRCDAAHAKCTPTFQCNVSFVIAKLYASRCM